MKQAKAKRTFLSAIKYFMLIVFSFISIFPFYWMFAGATNTSNDIAKGTMSFGSNLGINLYHLFSSYHVGRVMWNSIEIAVCSVGINLIVTSLAAFGFEKFKTKTSEKIYGVFLVSMMVPFSALMIPLFKMISGIHLANTAIAVILPTMASAFLIFFFRQNFKSFPNEILESARIDGATNLRAFFTIVIPTMKSTYAAAAIYAFMTAWNNYLWPLVILQSDDHKTMILLISGISTASYVADYGLQMVALVITTIPMMLVFFIMQKSFVEGMTGSVKG